MNKDQYNKFSNDFANKCDLVIKPIIMNNKYLKEIIKLTLKGDIYKRIGTAKANSQYENNIYWYRVLFKRPLEHKMNKKRIIGFHIMPFQITSKDVTNAEWKYGEKTLFKFNGTVKEKFNKESSKDTTYIDYDYDISGNFHKYPDNEFKKIQIVLIDEETFKKGHNGAGDPLDVQGNPFNNDLVNKLRKKEMYFPNILDEEIINGDNLDKLIKDAFDNLKLK